MVVPTAGRAPAGWILTVQSPFYGGEMVRRPCSANDGSAVVVKSWLLATRIEWATESTTGPGRHPYMKLTTTPSAGAVTSLDVSSRCCTCFPALNIGRNPRFGLRNWRRRCSYVGPFLEVSPRWFVESSVHQLELLLTAPQSVGFRGAMYIVAGASWSAPPPVWFSPAVLSLILLAAYGRVMRWLVPSWCWSRPHDFPVFGGDAA